MQDESRSTDELIRELHDLRRQVGELESEKERWRKIATIRGVSFTRDEQVEEHAEGNASEHLISRGAGHFHEEFEQAGDTAFLHTIDGKFVDVNSAACSQLGYTREELLTMSIPDIDPDADCNPRTQPILNAVANGESATLEARHHRKDGTSFPVEIALNLVRVKGEKLLLAIVRNISERKRAEELLRTSERKLSNAMKIARLGYWEYDEPTNLFTFDDLFYAIFRTTAEAVGGYTMTPEDYANRFCHPEDVHLVAEEMQKAKETDDPLFCSQLEHRILYADGETGYIAVRYFIVKDENGRTIKTYGANQDVTERHRAEELLRQAKQKAEAANLAKSEFLANMSHEIRTPMTAILGFADILIDGFADDADTQSEHLEAAKTIRRNGEHLLELINSILDLSKIEAGKLEVEFVPCSPHRLIAEVAELMQVRADAAGIALRLESDGPIPETIRTDPLRVRQILINIVGNAIKFTEFGSVTLRLRYDVGKSRLEFDVIDTGVGMTPKQAANLFIPFCQADATAARRFKGTGLGLTISRRLARLLGGDVWIAETSPGQGSCFRIAIATGAANRTQPVDEATAHVGAAAMADDDHRPTGILPLDGMHILLADDGPDNQRLVGHILRKAGARVVIAENGRIAIDAATQAEANEIAFDVILMDMQMPDMDGYAATRELRRRGYQAPIIALTANTLEQYRTECFNVGCDDFLAKPFNRGDLIALLSRHRRDDVKSKES